MTDRHLVSVNNAGLQENRITFPVFHFSFPTALYKDSVVERKFLHGETAEKPKLRLSCCMETYLILKISL